MTAPPVPSISLVRPEAPTGPPLVVTLADALQRAKQNEPAFLAAAADAAIAHGDRVQAQSRRCCRPSATRRSTSATGESGADHRTVRVDGRRQHVPRSGSSRTRRSRRTRSRARPLLKATGRGGSGAGQARNRAARPRRHRHADLLRVHLGAAQVRHGAAGRAAGAAILRDRAAAGASRPGRRAATS